MQPKQKLLRHRRWDHVRHQLLRHHHAEAAQQAADTRRQRLHTLCRSLRQSHRNCRAREVLIRRTVKSKSDSGTRAEDPMVATSTTGSRVTTEALRPGHLVLGPALPLIGLVAGDEPSYLEATLIGTVLITLSRRQFMKDILSFRHRIMLYIFHIFHSCSSLRSHSAHYQC